MYLSCIYCLIIVYLLQATDRQASAVSSTMSLAEVPVGRKGRRGSLPPESSLTTLEPLQHFIGEMPKNIMKNDYFVDINPRSMRRLMNIIAMAGLYWYHSNGMSVFSTLILDGFPAFKHNLKLRFFIECMKMKSIIGYRHNQNSLPELIIVC